MFEIIPGLRNREFTPDQEALVLAIKETEFGGHLWDVFQKYWQDRCDNASFLSEYDAWDVLDGYARDMFGRAEQYHVREYMKAAYQKRQSLSARDMAEIYLSVIHLMQMRYDDKEQVI